MPGGGCQIKIDVLPKEVNHIFSPNSNVGVGMPFNSLIPFGEIKHIQALRNDVRVCKYLADSVPFDILLVSNYNTIIHIYANNKKLLFNTGRYPAVHEMAMSWGMHMFYYPYLIRKLDEECPPGHVALIALIMVHIALFIQG